MKFNLKQFFNHNGRIGRLEYVLSSFMFVPAITILFVIAQMSMTAFKVLAVALTILIVYQSTVGAIKRLHDLNQSGAWMALFYFIQILFLVPIVLNESGALAISENGIYLINLMAILTLIPFQGILVFKKGMLSNNKHGLPDSGSAFKF